MNGPDTVRKAISNDILAKQSETNFLGLDTRQLRALTKSPENGKA
jgi:hypothetical protein